MTELLAQLGLQGGDAVLLGQAQAVGVQPAAAARHQGHHLLPIKQAFSENHESWVTLELQCHAQPVQDHQRLFHANELLPHA